MATNGVGATQDVAPPSETAEVPPSPAQASPAPAASKAPTCRPPTAGPTLETLLREVQSIRGRRLFVLATRMLTDETLEEVYRWRAELKDAGDADSLDILLHSPGGVLTSCYQIARLFSSRANAWDALIPSIAASGATLISLGSANIVMGETAFVGPIDPQVSSKRHEKLFASERQSPLEAFEAVSYLREFAITSLISNWTLLLEQRVAPKPALDAASSLAHHLVQPILSKIEPYDLGAFALDANLSIQYCTRVGNPLNPAKKTQRQVNYTALVRDYPAHEFVIDIEEAKELGFAVSAPPADLDTLFDRLRPLLNQVERYVGFVPDPEAAP